MGWKRSAYKVLIGKPERKRPFGRMEGGIKIVLKK
jgi:hypothetical protein